MSHSIFSFLATVLFFVPLFHFLWFSHFVCPPGVARVKLTRPDKDNSLTHSVVYFSPLLFPLFHSILLWSLTPLPYTLLFNCHRLFISSASVHPSYILFSSLAGNLFYSVISLSHCLLLHTRPSSSITPAICLSLAISLSTSALQLIHLSFYASVHPTDFPPLPPTRPFQVSTLPLLCQGLINFTPSFPFFHWIPPSSLNIPSSFPLFAFHNVTCNVSTGTYSG